MEAIKSCMLMVAFLGIVCLANAQGNPYSRHGRPAHRISEPHLPLNHVWMAANQWKLRWQPLGLVNTFDMNLTVGAEYSYRANKSLSIDAGYLFASRNGDNNNDGGLPPASGLLLRTAARFYFGKFRAWYFEASPMYKTVRYPLPPQWVNRGVVNGVPAYQQWMQFNRYKEVFVFDACLGVASRLDRWGKWNLENWFGLGIRIRHQYYRLPPDAMPINGGGTFFDIMPDGKSLLPNIPLGLRLTYKL